MQKVAAVTGSAKGLGKEIAFALSNEGYIVVVHYHNSAKEAKEVLTKIKKISPKSTSFSADLTDEKQVDNFAKKVFDKYGRVDVLVNNVGNFLYKEFDKTTNAEFRDILESNIYSTLFVSRAFLPVMRRQKSGNIINIGCVGAERIVIRKKSTPYFLAKTGVYMLTKVMAYEEAKNGISINSISPTSLLEDIFKTEDFPQGRSARYSDVISVLRFLLSDKAEYINGANIEVAGASVVGI